MKVGDYVRFEYNDEASGVLVALTDWQATIKSCWNGVEFFTSPALLRVCQPPTAERIEAQRKLLDLS